MEEVQSAIREGADVDAWSFGPTPSMFAAAVNPNPDVTELLLDAGADGSVEDRAGNTAFDYAKENEALVGTDVLRRLSEAGN